MNVEDELQILNNKHSNIRRIWAIKGHKIRLNEPKKKNAHTKIKKIN